MGAGRGAARFSQSVVAVEVAKAPAVMRRKLFSPEAAAIWSWRMPASASDTSGMKKHDTAAPCRMVGTTSVQISTCVLKRERIHATAANTTMDAVAYMRGSTLPAVRPTIGVSTSASTPTGASTSPASVAV